MCTFNRILKYTVFWMHGARDFEEHLDKVENDIEDEEEKEEDEKMNLESAIQMCLGKR